MSSCDHGVRHQAAARAADPESSGTGPARNEEGPGETPGPASAPASPKATATSAYATSTRPNSSPPTSTRTRYDVTHVQLTLSAAAAANGDKRQAVEYGAAARASIEAMGYGLLCHLYPEVAYSLADRIAGALTAYACGDALGVPWEGTPPDQISADEIERLPARKDWPRGATSDDTALTLLVARHLADRDGNADPIAFLEELADQAPAIRGLGPSTKAAIETFRETGELPTTGGATNGVAMRALPVGWIIPHNDPERRRRTAIEISRATHADPTAQVAACVIAACASWALEGADPDLILHVATDEARAVAHAASTDQRLASTLVNLAEGRPYVPTEGTSLDPCDTVAAVLSASYPRAISAKP